MDFQKQGSGSRRQIRKSKVAFSGESVILEAKSQRNFVISPSKEEERRFQNSGGRRGLLPETSFRHTKDALVPTSRVQRLHSTTADPRTKAKLVASQSLPWSADQTRPHAKKVVAVPPRPVSSHHATFTQVSSVAQATIIDSGGSGALLYNPEAKTLPSMTKKLCILVSDLVDSISQSEKSLQQKFAAMAFHHFDKENLKGLLQQKDNSEPSVSQILFGILRLPNGIWDDARRAQLIENLLRDVRGMSNMADKFRFFRLELLESCRSKNFPTRTADADDTKLNQAILITSKNVTQGWINILRYLDISNPVIAECEEKRSLGFQEACSHGLHKWKEEKGSHATISKLLQALHEANFVNIAEKIINGLNLSASEINKVFESESKSSNFESKKQLFVEPSRFCHSVEAATVGSTISQSRHVVLRSKASKIQAADDEHVDRDSTVNHPLPQTAEKQTISEQLLSDSVANLEEVVLVAPCSLPQKSEIEMQNFSDDKVDEKLALANRIPEEFRSVQIIVVGQTGVGKTKTMNRALGTMAKEGKPGDGSITGDVTTYTRTLYLSESTQPLELSFTDTPGFGDSHGRFSDEDICFTIQKAYRTNAEVFVLYFDKTDLKDNGREIKAIEKFEKLTGKKIDAVVFTHSSWKPTFGSFSEDEVSTAFEKGQDEIAKEWIWKPEEGPKALLKEYLDNFKDDNNADEQKELDKADASRQWTEKKKKTVLRLVFRRKQRRVKKAFYRENLKRSDLPILKVENSSEYKKQMGKFGIHQFHTKLGHLLERRAGELLPVFSLMTSAKVRELTSRLTKTSLSVEANNQCSIQVEQPEDISSEETKAARERSNNSLWKRFINFLLNLFRRKKTRRRDRGSVN